MSTEPTKKLVFFTVELYLDEEQEIHAAFEYRGDVLQGVTDEETAYDCFERGVRLRALVDAAFTDAETLLENMEKTSPEFQEKGAGH